MSAMALHLTKTASPHTTKETPNKTKKPIGTKTIDRPPNHPHKIKYQTVF